MLGWSFRCWDILIGTLLLYLQRWIVFLPLVKAFKLHTWIGTQELPARTESCNEATIVIFFKGQNTCLTKNVHKAGTGLQWRVQQPFKAEGQLGLLSIGHEVCFAVEGSDRRSICFSSGEFSSQERNEWKMLKHCLKKPPCDTYSKFLSVDKPVWEIKTWSVYKCILTKHSFIRNKLVVNVEAVWLTTALDMQFMSLPRADNVVKRQFLSGFGNHFGLA